MNGVFNALLANALLTIPIAVSVFIVTRFIRRPAIVHVLWIIVLLKFVSPCFFEFQVPGLSNITHQIASPIKRTAAEFEFTTAPRVNEQTAILHQDGSAASSPHRIQTKSLRNDGRMGQMPLRSRHSSDVMTRSQQRRTGHMIVADAPLTLRDVLIGIWVLGTSVFFIALVHRARRFHQFVRRAPDADEAIQTVARAIAERYGLPALPRIRVAKGDFPPLLWIVPGSASIVLPQKLIASLGPNAIRNFLAHELAHFARRDHWVRLCESVVLGVFWWHPLAWWAKRQLQHAEELCCDAWVLWAYPKSQAEYARTLLATLDYLSAGRAALPPLASGLGRSNLIRRRFEMILHHQSPRRLSAHGTWATAFFGLAILPWSTSTLAHPDSTPQSSESILKSAGSSQDIGSPQSAEKADQQSRQEIQQPQRIPQKQDWRKVTDRIRSRPSDFRAAGEDLQTLIHSTIRRAVREAQEGLKQAEPHIAKDVYDEVSQSLDDLSKSDWFYGINDTLDAIDSISDEEIDEIAEHVATAAEHFGKAVMKSTETFARVLKSELEEIEEQFDEALDSEEQRLSKSLSRLQKAVESVGPTKEAVQHMGAALAEMVEKVEARLKNHSENSRVTGADKTTSKSTVNANRKPGDESKRKAHYREQQIRTLLRQIKSLVEQLEAKVESHADAASTIR